MKFSRGLPLLLSPSIFPVTTMFSSPCFLMICPRKLICPALILFINLLSVLPAMMVLREKKAIDHIIISRRWLRRVTQCRVFRGAQLGNSDHRLLCANICLKLEAPRSRQLHQPDISRLADHSTKLLYLCEVSNRYDVLAESTDQWEDFKNTITACATKCLGRRRSRPKKPWITHRRPLR